MSFSSEIKHELCMLDDLKPCCKVAQIYGLSLFGCYFFDSKVYVKSENKEICELFAQLSAEYMGFIADINSYYRNKNKLVYCANLAYERDNLTFIKKFGHKSDEINLKINKINFKDENCIKAFIRGAFLSCSSVTDPNIEYRIEFKTKYLKLSEQFINLIKSIEALNISPKISNKKGYFIVYIKGAEAVSDVLTFLGAHNSVMNFIQVKILKEIRNNINRTNNFETANIDRTVKASVKQLNAIKIIDERKGLNFLDEPLKKVAKVRMENPQSSLNELCKFIPGITKSGLNHRLNKIVSISEKLK